MSDEILGWGALELAGRIRARELSALDAVEAHIARLETVNPVLNALVADRFDAARAEARALDAAGTALPLGGVPFTVKEMIAVAGMPHTFGNLRRRDRVSAEDATVVRRLRAAGAIPLGVSNVPEWGMWIESYNNIYGRTKNPWDTGRTPGGSSGGEGAIAGAGGSVFGLGSDIGGSVRMPAAFCGVYGHKPSTGLLPLTGHYPVYRSGPDAALRRTSRYVTIGTVTRSAHDIAPLLRVMLGADDIDPNTAEVTLRDGPTDWRGRRVLVLAAPSIARAARADDDAQRAVETAAAALERRGAILQEAPPKLLARANDVWSAALQSDGVTSFAEVLGAGERVHLLREVFRTARGRGEYSWPALFFCAGERLGHMSERRRAHVMDGLQAMSREVDALCGDGGVILMPAHPRVAPRHNTPILRPFDFLYTAVWNALRMPATVAPWGFDAGGMPLSVQIASAYGNDHLTIAAAEVLEEASRPWRPAPLPT